MANLHQATKVYLSDGDFNSDEDYQPSDDSLSDHDIFNTQEYKQYCDEVQASQGFDVKLYRNVDNSTIGMIKPLSCLEPDLESLRHYTNKAIEDENKKKGTKLKLDRILKANLQAACPINYYITFDAKDGDGPIKTYQTKVLRGIPKENYEVEIFRLKPNMEEDDVNKEEADDSHEKGKIEDAVYVVEEEADHSSKKQKIEDRKLKG